MCDSTILEFFAPGRFWLLDFPAFDICIECIQIDQFSCLASHGASIFKLALFYSVNQSEIFDIPKCHFLIPKMGGRTRHTFAPKVRKSLVRKSDNSLSNPSQIHEPEKVWLLDPKVRCVRPPDAPRYVGEILVDLRCTSGNNEEAQY